MILQLPARTTKSSFTASHGSSFHASPSHSGWRRQSNQTSRPAPASEVGREHKSQEEIHVKLFGYELWSLRRLVFVRASSVQQSWTTQKRGGLAHFARVARATGHGHHGTAWGGLNEARAPKRRSPHGRKRAVILNSCVHACVCVCVPSWFNCCVCRISTRLESMTRALTRSAWHKTATSSGSACA